MVAVIVEIVVVVGGREYIYVTSSRAVSGAGTSALVADDTTTAYGGVCFWVENNRIEINIIIIVMLLRLTKLWPGQQNNLIINVRII